MQIPIAPAVHRSIYSYAVKDFIEKQGKDPEKKVNELNLSKDELRYHKVLDHFISKDEIDESEVNRFLFNQINYGRMKNIFGFEIRNIQVAKFSSFQGIIHCINSLKYKNSENVKKEFFLNDIRKGLRQNEKELLYFKTFFDNNGHLEEVHILLAKGIKNNNGQDCNHYIPVEIKFKERLVYFRMKNWGTSANFYGFKLEEEAKKIAKELENAFDFSLKMPLVKIQNILTKMLKDLTQTVLLPTQEEVNKLIEKEVKLKVRDWAKAILPPHITLTNKDYGSIEKHILNHYYSYNFKFTHADLNTDTIQKIFEVPGYPTYVKFTDDTISEARTKSQSTEQTLLLTSIYYDLKARLDEANQIRLATVYWTDAPIKKNLGVSYYGEVQEQFKIVIKYNFFNKEIYDYVLRKIRKYY